MHLENTLQKNPDCFSHKKWKNWAKNKNVKKNHIARIEGLIPRTPTSRRKKFTKNQLQIVPTFFLGMTFQARPQE